MARGTQSRAWTGLEPLEGRSLLAAVAWDGGGGDFSWHNPLNWSGDALPGPEDDVLISVPGTPLILFTAGEAAVRSLRSLEAIEVSGGTLAIGTEWRQSALLMISGGRVEGAGDFLLNGPVLWSGGTLAGSGHALVLPGRELRIAGNVTLARTINNNGSLVWESGNITGTGGTILNLTGRTFEMRSPGQMLASSGVNIISNSGTIARLGPGVSTVAFWLNNPATVDVREGTLRLVGPIVQRDLSVLRGGIWAVSSGSATLDMVGPNITMGFAHYGPLEIRLHGAGSSFPQFETAAFITTNSEHPASARLSGGRGFGALSLWSVSDLTLDNPGITVLPAGFNGRVRVLQGVVVAPGGQGGPGITSSLSAEVAQGAELLIAGATGVQDLSGPGLVRIAAPVDWSKGEWTGGPVVITSGGALRITGSYNRVDTLEKYMSRRVVNHGSILWDDTWGSWQLGAELVNRGTFRIHTAGHLGTTSGLGPTGTPATITNFGTIVKDSPFAVVFRGAGGGVRLANHGLVQVSWGMLVLNGGGRSTGQFEVSNAIEGAELIIGGLPSVYDSASFSGSSRVRVASASTWTGVNFSGTGDLLITAPARLTTRGASVWARSAVQNNGIWTAAGTVEIQSGLTNAGTLDLGDVAITVQGDLTLLPSSIVRGRFLGQQAYPRLVASGLATLGGSLEAYFQFPVLPGITFDFLRAGQMSEVLAVFTPFGHTPGTIPVVRYTLDSPAMVQVRIL